MSDDLKIPFALKNGVIVGIEDVPRGLACGCFCLSCGGPLMAKKGEVNSHHFSHKESCECESAVETAVHLMAKQIILENKAVLIPRYGIHMGPDRGVVAHEKLLQFDEVVAEKSLCVQPDKWIIPDLSCRVGDAPFYIEIRVTHKVDSAKRAAYKALDVGVIEIDLSSVLRQINKEELTNLLMGNAKNSDWIHHPRAKRVREQVKLAAEDRERHRQQELSQQLGFKKGKKGPLPVSPHLIRPPLSDAYLLCKKCRSRGVSGVFKLPPDTAQLKIVNCPDCGGEVSTESCWKN